VISRALEIIGRGQLARHAHMSVLKHGENCCGHTILHAMNFDAASVASGMSAALARYPLSHSKQTLLIVNNN
jgi:hypothetical protein